MSNRNFRLFSIGHTTTLARRARYRQITDQKVPVTGFPANRGTATYYHDLRLHDARLSATPLFEVPDRKCEIGKQLHC